MKSWTIRKLWPNSSSFESASETSPRERGGRPLVSVSIAFSVSKNDEIEWLYYRKTKVERIKDKYVIPKRVSVLLGFKSNFSLMECPAQSWVSFQLYLLCLSSFHDACYCDLTHWYSSWVCHNVLLILCSSLSRRTHSRPFNFPL